MKSTSEVCDLQHSLLASARYEDEPIAIKKESKRKEDVLDVACEKADIRKIVSECTCLTTEQRNGL